MNESLSNLKVVAAGGGGASTSSRPAIEAALDLAVPDKPNVLIIPTPKRTQEAFDKTIPATEAFFRKLGLKTALLHQFNEPLSTATALDHIENADFIYTTGGDTLHMMEQFHHYNIAAPLAQRALQGEVVLSGISAGAILSTKWGHSDSLSYRPETAGNWEYVRVDGLGIAPFAITPHFSNTHERLGARSDQFRAMLTREPATAAFGIDNLAAIRLADGKLTQLQSNPDQFVHIARSNNDGSIDFHPLTKHDSIDLETL